ncbi:hypothetical protein HYPSUDRAFT_80337 [Hypholoma sublateritium FD-334 SS-4]|uniref:Uncharacterized protein n=1 Tax=Hypholoma sublateritium (strain FD-334 SS-4) TaxID=945553 RepID=A0A0D2NGW4_HYPSF|nr:hypothetical protein HYPSUDRAFT_80337 [Hypholoma sublateritium FD-334 SS-4]
MWPEIRDVSKTNCEVNLGGGYVEQGAMRAIPRISQGAPLPSESTDKRVVRTPPPPEMNGCARTVRPAKNSPSRTQPLGGLQRKCKDQVVVGVAAPGRAQRTLTRESAQMTCIHAGWDSCGALDKDGARTQGRPGAGANESDVRSIQRWRSRRLSSFMSVCDVVENILIMATVLGGGTDTGAAPCKRIYGVTGDAPGSGTRAYTHARKGVETQGVIMAAGTRPLLEGTRRRGALNVAPTAWRGDRQSDYTPKLGGMITAGVQADQLTARQRGGWRASSGGGVGARKRGKVRAVASGARLKASGDDYEDVGHRSIDVDEAQ